MAKVKEIPLGRPHQVRAYRYARRLFSSRKPCGGVILADGVGMGKTYEALALAATWLSQRQHFKQRMPEKLRVLVLVPPGLFTKWEDELLLPDCFPRYVAGWTSPATEPIARTFRDVALLRRRSDLERKRGVLRYGHRQLPAGLYLVNSRLLLREGSKVTQLHRTAWDCVIVDEAHHHSGELMGRDQMLLAPTKTATILLTATPFQLTPHELKELLALTFGGYGSRGFEVAEASAAGVYDSESFLAYRKAVLDYFESGEVAATREAQRWRSEAGTLLRKRVVRSPKKEARRYFFVDKDGGTTEVGPDLFRLDDVTLNARLRTAKLIALDAKAARIYMDVRSEIASACSSRKRPFVAAALRQLLSSYAQFRQSDSGRLSLVQLPKDDAHPKLAATVKLAKKTISTEQQRHATEGSVGKVLVFTTYVGAEHGKDQPTGEKAHGTAAELKTRLSRELRDLFPPADKETKQRVGKALARKIEDARSQLKRGECERLLGAARRFAGSRAAAFLLRGDKPLARETRALGRLLADLGEAVGDDGREMEDSEAGRRRKARRERVFQAVLDRYSTRDLVARYDGATKRADRDRHLRGFNSPFAPMILIASSVGQEGIDLQRYCRHIIHYDLEWNPAKLEQREGRVDREGRLASGPVKVYFPLCRGTYDERMLHVMVNRFRWHQVLLNSRRALQGEPTTSEEQIAQKTLKRITLDLKPRGRGL